ncbi:MAG: AmmeMemoRadiSam system radical SAM enzyme [Candidatus Aminicenantes bacterium]|nr:AmmeMemoRadiSam system radical SAM enzyme [Candidatus Aminicenantes bacterium]
MKKRDFLKGMMAVGGGCLAAWSGRAAGGGTGDPRPAAETGEKEASHYAATPRGVKCLICPNECTLKEGEVSDCHNRVARGGKLYTMAYGNPCAVHIDPVEKKPLLHFHPGSLAFSIATAGCNFACLNCQNWEISQASPRETRNVSAGPEAVVASASRENCRSIAYTYSEPVTFFEYMRDTAVLARARGIQNIMVSNGYINRAPLLEICRVVDAANIDLKSFDPGIHLKLTAGKIEPVLETLKTIKAEGVWLEITNLIIPGWTDDFKMIGDMCDWLMREGFAEVPLHFSRFQPLHKLTRLPPTPVPTLVRAKEIAVKAGLKFVYIGNVPGLGGEDTFCPGCKTRLLRRRGFAVSDNILKDGKCPKCAMPIPGRWG